jgi:hypothetical protein
MKLLFSFVFIVFHSIVFAATYYVSPTGTDTNNGSLAFPFKTITKAISSSVAGDIIYLRGGVHTYSTRINISKAEVQQIDSTYGLTLVMLDLF